MSNTNKRRIRRARRAQGTRRARGARGTRRAQGKRRSYRYSYGGNDNVKSVNSVNSKIHEYEKMLEQLKQKNKTNKTNRNPRFIDRNPPLRLKQLGVLDALRLGSKEKNKYKTKEYNYNYNKIKDYLGESPTPEDYEKIMRLKDYLGYWPTKGKDENRGFFVSHDGDYDKKLFVNHPTALKTTLKGGYGI